MKRKSIKRFLATTMMSVLLTNSIVPYVVLANDDQAIELEDDGTGSAGNTVVDFETDVNVDESEIFYGDYSSLPDDTALFAEYVERVFDREEDDIVYSAKKNIYNITSVEERIFEALYEDIANIANGARSSSVMTVNINSLLDKTEYSAEDLGLTSIIDNDQISPEAREKMMELVSFNMNNIMNVLFGECAYELYWYDKARGVSVRTFASFECKDNKISFTDDSYFEYSFAASVDYSKDGEAGTFVLDVEKTGAAKKAAENAIGIIEENASLSDYEKLYKYLLTICDAVSYNFSVLSGDVEYGDPWQLIYVFDNDPTTNVVCEGYSKAFQYLCDNSEFQGNIECYTVFGDMWSQGSENKEAHMWNIVPATVEYE